LSPTSVRYVHTIIHRALKDAVKWGRLSRNQPTRQTRPGPTRQPAGIGDLGHLPAAHVP
jgi:hypothetical protein